MNTQLLSNMRTTFFGTRGKAFFTSIMALLLIMVIGGSVLFLNGTLDSASANYTFDSVKVNSHPLAGPRCPVTDQGIYTFAQGNGPWTSYALNIQNQGKLFGEKTGFDGVVYNGNSNSQGDGALFAAEVGTGQISTGLPAYGDPTPYTATHYVSWVQVIVKGIPYSGGLESGCISNVLYLSNTADSASEIANIATASESWWANGNSAKIITTAARVLTNPLRVTAANWVTTPYQGEQKKMVDAFHDRTMTGQLWTLKLAA